MYKLLKVEALATVSCLYRLEAILQSEFNLIVKFQRPVVVPFSARAKELAASFFKLSKLPQNEEQRQTLYLFSEGFQPQEESLRIVVEFLLR